MGRCSRWMPAALAGRPRLVDRILKGAPPGSLPIAEPDGRLLGVNLQAAQDLGLVPSPAVRGRAQVTIPAKERTSLGARLLLILLMADVSERLDCPGLSFGVHGLRRRNPVRHAGIGALALVLPQALHHSAHPEADDYGGEDRAGDLNVSIGETG